MGKRARWAVSGGFDFRQIARRALPFALALALLIFFREKVGAALVGLRHVHPIVLVSLPLFLLWNQVATLAWQRLLRAVDVVSAPIGELARFRIEAQAVNQVVPAAGLAGEALRTSRAVGANQLAAASTATALDNAAGTLAGLVFSMAAVSVHFLVRGTEQKTLVLAGVGGAAFLLAVAVVALPFQLAPSLLPRLRRSNVASNVIYKALSPFVLRPKQVRRAFRDAVVLRFVERILAAAEVYIAFRATGSNVGIVDAALVTAVLILVSFAAFFLPGQIGAAEAAVASASSLIGLPAVAGLSAVLVRRGRQLVVCGIGGASLLFRARHPSGDAR